MSENNPTPTAGLAERLRDLASDRCCDFTGYGERSGPHDPELLAALHDAADALDEFRAMTLAHLAPYQNAIDPSEPYWLGAGEHGDIRHEPVSPLVAGVLWPEENPTTEGSGQ